MHSLIYKCMFPKYLDVRGQLFEINDVDNFPKILNGTLIFL